MDNPLRDIFEKEGKWVQVYQGVENVTDPFEKNVTVANINPVSIRAIVRDFSAAKAQWVMPGVQVSQVKELYVDSKYRSLVENSQAFAIRNSVGQMETFEGWRQNGKMQIREEGACLRLYIYSKKNNGNPN